MKGFLRLTMACFMVCLLTNCATQAPESDSSEALDQGASSSAQADNGLEGDLEAPADQAKNGAAKKDDFAEFDEQKAPPPEEPVPPAQELGQNEVPPPAVDAGPEAPPPPAPVQEAPPAVSSTVTLQALQYKGNDNGGTIVVEANGPMTFSTRTNKDTNQFIVEIPNTIMPKKLMRNLNTRDFEGTIASIDAYQNKGSDVSRIVVQLRPGAPEPVVQAEGNNLLVVAQSAETNAPVEPVQSKLMSYDSLEDFLAGNMTFYGKRISLETDDMDIRDLFKLVSEESGVNLVIADEVRGKMSVKLRQVPWDQALVMIMKAKKLSYTRSGNVLRIAPVADLRQEEDDSIKIANNRKSLAPLKVRLVPISYSKIDELEKQVKPFLSTRGTVVGDARTSSLVVSDIEESIERIVKLIQSIDVPPHQVLIEGKVVEATEQFERKIGISWRTAGRPYKVGSNGSTDIRGTTSIGINPGLVSNSAARLDFSLGTMDLLGDLSATLTLNEQEGFVKVLSSPRIVTLHNEPAEINQTSELPIITSTPTQTGVGIPTVTFKPVRLKLSVLPQITNDGAVIMGVDVNREFPGDVADLATQARPINSRSAKTKVLVRNGQTAVIGGIYQVDSQDSNTKVPGLGDIPFVGWLFKSKSVSKQKNELLIFLTPRILGQLDSQAIPSQQEGGGEF